MHVSIIIPTYNGAHKIVRALEAVRQQGRQGFEVIVVIDGSTDDTEAVIRRQGTGLENLRIIVQKNGGRSISRNHGAKIAQGELLIFLDDDMRPTADWLQTHLAKQTQHPNTIQVGGQLEDFAVIQTDFQHYKAQLSRKWSAEVPQKEPLQKHNLFLTAANFSISKALFFQLGGFDERLTDAEDFDLGVRAFQQGIPIYFDKDNIAWHDDFITCQSYIKRLKQYAQAHQKLLALNPETYASYPQYQPQSMSFTKKVVYSFFRAGYWVWLIDRMNVLKILPARLRYKLYDIITYAHTK